MTEPTKTLNYNPCSKTRPRSRKRARVNATRKPSVSIKANSVKKIAGLVIGRLITLGAVNPINNRFI